MDGHPWACNMLSRVAENLYWMSRYVERVENVARLLDDGFHLELDTAGLAGDDGQGTLDSVLTILACRDAFEKAGSEGGRNAVLRFLTFDRSSEFSLLAMLARARENARSTQESLSSEAWSQINQMYLYLSGPRAQRRYQTSPFRFYERVVRECILFEGLVDSTLPRSEVFHFIQVGRYLERVNQIGNLLRFKLHALRDGGPVADLSLHTVYWTSLLRSCSAYEAFLRGRQNRIDAPSVVHYLVLEADFPRAMRFGVARCLESLREIAGGDDDAYASEAERLLGRLDSELRYMDITEIFHRGATSFLSGVQETCARVGEEMHRAYFLG
jgi:uncharacterized alpha-E superfamily protein